jgi:hypothetical protein
MEGLVVRVLLEDGFLAEDWPAGALPAPVFDDALHQLGDAEKNLLRTEGWIYNRRTRTLYPRRSESRDEEARTRLQNSSPGRFNIDQPTICGRVDVGPL